MNISSEPTPEQVKAGAVSLENKELYVSFGSCVGNLYQQMVEVWIEFVPPPQPQTPVWRGDHCRCYISSYGSFGSESSAGLVLLLTTSGVIGQHTELPCHSTDKDSIEWLKTFKI